MWPVALDVDSSLLRLAPCDLADGSPVTFLEAQYARDGAGRCGVRVVYCLADETTNYVWEPHLALEPVDVPLRGPIAHNAPGEFSSAVFELGEGGITIDIAFTAGVHNLMWRVRQPRPWKGFDFLAPPAAAIAEPTSLFFPYMRQFSFVLQPMDFAAAYDGQPLAPKKLPFLWGGRRALSIKAARGNTVVKLLPDGASAVCEGADADERGHLVSLRQAGVMLSFSPALPPVNVMRGVGAGRYEWSLSVEDDPTMGGTVTLAPDGKMTWTVERSWTGVKQRGTAWVLTRIIPFLTRWPLHYSWSGYIADDDSIHGAWTNAKPKT